MELCPLCGSEMALQVESDGSEWYLCTGCGCFSCSPEVLGRGAKELFWFEDPGNYPGTADREGG